MAKIKEIEVKVNKELLKSIKDLQFCFDELLGELGWDDEIEETGVDPLSWARNEIKDLHKEIKRLRVSLELRNASSKTANIYRWFFENVTSVVERDYEAVEFAREIATELRRTYEKLEVAEQPPSRKQVKPAISPLSAKG